MDYQKNRCTVCKKMFCCAAHRSDHEIKNHPETCPKLQEDFLTKLFQKRGQTINRKPQTHSVPKQVNDFKETDDNNLSENNSNKFIFKKPRKRVYKEISKGVSATSVVVSETRKILVPIHRVPENNLLTAPNHNKQILLKKLEGSFKTPPYACNVVKTSTPIVEGFSKENMTPDNWDYISPASTISYYGTPNLQLDFKSEAKSALRSQPIKASVTPLRGIICKNSKYLVDSEMGPSPNFNTSKGRKVTFSFSSSRISSTSSPLESVQEIEIHEEIQEGKGEVFATVTSAKNLSKREVSASVFDENNFVLEVTSTVNSCVESTHYHDENMTNMQRFTEDSLVSINGGLFSCMTNMFCSAVQTFPLWRGMQNTSRSKRSRSPNRESDNAVVVHSPLPKRPCFTTDLRLNPIRARKPISHP